MTNFKNVQKKLHVERKNENIKQIDNIISKKNIRSKL